MPQYENDFSNKDFTLVGQQVPGVFGSNGDYIRLTVLPTEATGNIVRLGNGDKAIFYSTLQDHLAINTSPFRDGELESSYKIIGSNGNDFKIYKNEYDGNIYVKPNEIFNDFGLPQGSYRLKLDFLNQLNAESGYTSEGLPTHWTDFSNPDNNNISPDYLATLPFPEWYHEYNTNGDNNIDVTDTIEWVTAGRPDIAEYIQRQVSPADYNEPSVYIFPSNLLWSPPIYPSEPSFLYNFVIKQISTSRKEVRLKFLNDFIVRDDERINILKDKLGNDNLVENYNFEYFLNIGTGEHIPIMNYVFDEITDGKDNQSIILKLYEPLPRTTRNISLITLEREVLITQTEDIFYFSDVPDVFFGDGLEPDNQENWINPSDLDFQYQNYNDLTGSIDGNLIQNIISESLYKYPNLNTNFNEFANHTFFGSAKRKLVNFKSKVQTIQNYYSEISQSLSANGIGLSGDTDLLIQQRQDLFNKIENEINSFTPYEKWLYTNGQSDSTASAPGIGENYTDTIPVNVNSNYYLGQINGGDGFNVLYHHSNENSGDTPYSGLFTNKYYAHKKPFFNYSGSFYLSFLMKGDTGSAIINQNSNNSAAVNGLGVPLPQDARYINNVLVPDITGSTYNRYIFHSSQSYWIPSEDAPINADFNNLMNSPSNFSAGTSAITVLSGSIKTGSYQVKDATGYYPTTTPAIIHSGSLFSGSCMPAGELFRVFYQNKLSSSLLAHYNYEGVVIDDNDFEVPDVSGNNNNLNWVGAGGSSYTSASLELGVDGKTNSALGWSGSISGAVGNMNLQDDHTSGSLGYTEFTGSSAFTMATWIKSSDSSSSDGFTVMAIDIKSSGSIKHNNTVTSSDASQVTGSNADGWWIGISGSSSVKGEVTDKGYTTINPSTHKTVGTTVIDNTWHHIAMTYDNNTGTSSLYVDGKRKKQTSGTKLTGSNNIFRLVVGTGPGGATGYGDASFDETRFYTRALADSEINKLYLRPDGLIETKITDVKITTNNPANAQPFSQLYHTSSAEWTSWYDGIYDSASAFDTDNIHSFENNLPEYIRESNEYNDLKDFLALQGEHYDMIRNHVDSLSTIYDRGYTENDSAPTNTLPVLLDNIGWEAINPFTGSLSSSLGSYLSSVTTVDDIKNNTWRKALNNLIYIYKSKGTENSVRALLNVYGYPPDVLQFNQYGGTFDFSDDFLDEIPDDNIPDTDLGNITGSIGFFGQSHRFYSYNFNGQKKRKLNIDWWMGNFSGTADANNIEFVYKHTKTTNTQTILKSSGSGTQNLWDLTLIPSSDGLSSSLQFRLNNSLTGALAIASNAVSMSTPYSKVKDGSIWNVMLQRMTSSVSGAGIQEYRLHSSLQDSEKIKIYNYVTMSVSGGAAVDSNHRANNNWYSTGSRHYLSGSNLVVGENLTGSLGEIKAYTFALSRSVFREHTFNKISTIGNNIDSHRKELIYHFKLNENYTSASVSASNQRMAIVDSAPKAGCGTLLLKDYSLTKSGSVFNTGSVYGNDKIELFKFSIQDNLSGRKNRKNIIVDPTVSVVSNLSPHKPAVKKVTDDVGQKPTIKVSTKLELYRSPQNFIDDYIFNTIGSANFEKYYGNPQYYYSASYTDFDDLRKCFFQAHPIEVDTNKFIRSHESMFNQSIIQGLNSVIPARSTFSTNKSNYGVEIRQTILEKQKYDHDKSSVELNPNLATGSINFVENTEYKQSSFALTLETEKSASIDINYYTISSSYDLPKSGSIDINYYSISSSYDLPKSGSIDINYYTISSSYDLPKSGSIDINYYNISSSYDLPKSCSIDIDYYTISSSYDLPKSCSISIPPSMTGSIESPVSGTNDYFSTNYSKTFVNIHNNWGTSSADTHFINYFYSGSYNDFNTGHVDDRFVFHMIGDTEIYSGSGKVKGLSNFTESSAFYNRTILSTGVYKDITYSSYINGNPGNQTGAMLGKTRYFIIGSDNNIILPSNHVAKYSQPFKEQMYKGAQNINPGMLNVKQTDYSTSSFYRVKVTGGENQIRIAGNSSPKLDSDNKISYNN